MTEVCKSLNISDFQTVDVISFILGCRVLRKLIRLRQWYVAIVVTHLPV